MMTSPFIVNYKFRVFDILKLLLMDDVCVSAYGKTIIV